MRVIMRVTLGASIIGFIFGCTSETSQTETASIEKAEVVHKYVGKPSAPILMNYEISNKQIEAGEEFEVNIEFSTSTKSEISLASTSAKTLNLLSDSKNWRSDILKPGEKAKAPSLRLIATENGTHYIKLVASIQHEGKIKSKPFVIPVVVGDGQVNLKAAGEVITDDKGQKVIIQKGDSTN